MPSPPRLPKTLRSAGAALLCALVALTGCDSEAEERAKCPDAQLVDGGCQDATDARVDDAADSTPVDTGETTSCTPGDFRCATATAIETCGQDGSRWNRQECGEGLVCDDGRCIEGDVCTPGAVQGCASATSQRVCADDGITDLERACPSATPNCFDGECIEGSCLPDRVFCDQDTLSRCNSRGDGSTTVETCEHGCADGNCLEPPDERCTAKDYIGCDFWAVDLDNYTKRCSTSLDCSIGACQSGICVEEDANRQQFSITVSNVSDETVEVEVIGPNNIIAASENLAPDALRRIRLPQRDSLDSSRHIRSYRVRASGPIMTHQFNPESNVGVFSNDASLLLPTNALGTDYRVVGWPTLEQPSLATFPSTNKAYVTIVAAEPGQTHLTVETPVAIQAGPDVPELEAASSQSFTLNQGMVLQLATIADSSREYDLTGLSIMSSKKVAVFSAHECAFVPTNNPACDHLEQQLMPTTTWGSEHVAAKFAPRGREDDIYRVLAAVDGTKLDTTPDIDGVDGEVLGAGEALEFASDTSFVVESTEPVSVAQFMVGALYPGPLQGCDPASGVEHGCLIDTRVDCEIDGEPLEFPIGDPAFNVVVPGGQFRSEYVVMTPEGYRDDYLSVVATADTTVTIDGEPMEGTTNPIEGSNWTVTWVQVEPGTHEVEADQPVGLYSYGYECFVSYAYPGGLNLSR